MSQNTAATHAARTVIELREKIISGQLTGGTRLFEVPLAEELQISRTPLRDAMSRLTEEGLLERLKNGGFVVRTFTMDDVVDAIELRGVLEGTAARLAAERGAAPELLSRMESLVSELDNCFGKAHNTVDFEQYSELNAEFHQVLASLSGSDMVKREVERVCRLPFASPSAFLPDRSDIVAFRRSLQVAQEQHRAIAAAIAAREGSRAEHLAREHARTARRNLDYVLRQEANLRDQVPSLAIVSN
ncbi:GntR family transcriptional regulator [Hoeflea sp. CAU 1731]